jgi:hypothetical protein
MGTLSRQALPAFALPQEEHTVPALGGAVLVRGLGMPALMQFAAARRQHAEQPAQLLPLLLALAVVLDDGEPAYTAPEWAAFGARHPEAAAELFGHALRLSGQDAAAEKKT